MPRRRCGSGDLCFAPARESGWLCEEHAAIIHAIADRAKKEARKRPPNKVGNPYAKHDAALALKLAVEVENAEGSEAELAERLGLRVASDQFAAVLDLAVKNGSVREVNGFLSRGSKRPYAPKRPLRSRAEQLARLVRAANHPVKRADAAAALDLSTRSLPPVAKLAREQGWIATVRGRSGGYVPGSAEPPQAVAA